MSGDPDFGKKMEGSSEYMTLEGESKAILREKMSKFIAIAFPITSSADAKLKLKKIANDYHDARHVCWAYIAGATGNEAMSNDNGEPSGTAGRPILGQIRSAGLTNVALAVVRYFGGIKLGTSGLIDAYKESARQAIANGVKVFRLEESDIRIKFGYEKMENVMRILKNSAGNVISQAFEAGCIIDYRIRKDKREEIVNRLSEFATVGDISDFSSSDDVLNG